MRPPEDQRVRVRLHDILNAIIGIQGTVGGIGFETYLSVWHMKHASERGLEIISEASRHIPDELKDAEPTIPWRQISGIGNVLRHDYQVISDHVVWDIIANHLDELEAAVRRMLKVVDEAEVALRTRQ
jgi:uncharacterized protein with HEPN domain